jgi:hypothetical protein
LFVTGAELAWDLDRPSGPTASDRTFFEGTLKGNYVSDDANTYNLAAAAGGIFAGLANFSFDDGTSFYNSEFPDVINPQAGAQAALTYSGGTGGTAAIQVPGTGGRGSVVMFGFPFETITTAANRAAVIDRVFDFFNLAALPPDNADFDGDGEVGAADYVVWRKFNGASVPAGTNGDANFDGQADDDDRLIWGEQFGSTPAGAGGAAFDVDSATTSESKNVEAFKWSLLNAALNSSSTVARSTNVLRAPVLSATRTDWASLLARISQRGISNDATEAPPLVATSHDETSDRIADADIALRRLDDDAVLLD